MVSPQFGIMLTFEKGKLLSIFHQIPMIRVTEKTLSKNRILTLCPRVQFIQFVTEQRGLKYEEMWAKIINSFTVVFALLFKIVSIKITFIMKIKHVVFIKIKFSSNDHEILFIF